MEKPERSAARGRKIARDVARIEFRKGNIRLALAILLWPSGWSHTRLDVTCHTTSENAHGGARGKI